MLFKLLSKETRPFSWFGLLVVGMMMLGCGSGGVSLKGKVSYDNNVVDQGAITLIPASASGKKVGGIIKDGTFEIPKDKGLVAGQYKVEITWAKKTGKKVQEEPGSKEFVSEERKQAIPAKYNSQTTLQVTLKSGENVEDFLLTK